MYASAINFWLYFVFYGIYILKLGKIFYIFNIKYFNIIYSTIRNNSKFYQSFFKNEIYALIKLILLMFFMTTIIWGISKLINIIFGLEFI